MLAVFLPLNHTYTILGLPLIPLPPFFPSEHTQIYYPLVKPESHMETPISLLLNPIIRFTFSYLLPQGDVHTSLSPFPSFIFLPPMYTYSFSPLFPSLSFKLPESSTILWKANYEQY